MSKRSKKSQKSQPVAATPDKVIEPVRAPTQPKSPAGQTISLCMIVRNEEEWIRQAIESVKPIVSEIIVVDTGSDDQTVKIAEELGAKVFHQPWENDFAKHRNYSIEQATGDWILILDADEAIAKRDLQTLQEQTKDRSICWEFLQRHYTNDHRLSEFKPVTGEYPEWEFDNGGYFESNCVRMFPNREGLNYQGRVHELVEHSIRQKGAHKIQRTPVRIQHYGHTDKVLAKKDKSAIYTSLGQEKLKDDPSYWQAHFEMGVEHNRNGRHWQSVMAFLQALTFQPEYLPAWVNMGYVLCEMGRYRQAEFSLRSALEIDPRNDEAFCNLGVVFMRTNRLPQAEQAFRAALNVNPKYVNAACNLGKTLAMMRRIPEAVMVYRTALEEMPNCTVAKADLGAIYLQERLFPEAEKYLSAALQEDPQNSRTYFHIGQLFRATGRVADAVRALEQFCVREEARMTPATTPPERNFIERVRREVANMRERISP